MKKTLLVYLVFLTACGSMDMRYEAQIETEKGMASYTFEETVKTRGAAWFCGLTVIFYGGGCWAYYGQPYQSSVDEIRRDAEQELREKYRLTNYQIKSERSYRRSWNEVTRTSNLIKSYEQPLSQK